MADVTPIRTLLAEMSQDEFQRADDVLVSYLHALHSFPKAIGLEGQEMTATELARFHDGWDAALNASSFIVALLLGRTDEFLQSCADRSVEFKFQQKTPAADPDRQET